MIVDETGGLHGLRDRGAVASLVALPQQVIFGRELYSNIYHKAAVYARSIIKNHPFLDGNKRTGMSVAIIFLENNGMRCRAKKGEIEVFAIKVAKGKLDVEEIARWFVKRCR